MYVCYVDDSGDSRHGTTLSALLIEAQHWSGVLDAWLGGRRAIHEEFGVRKHAELHALDLYKGRGRFCETPEHEDRFGTTQRAAAGRIVLNHLSHYPHFHVATVATREVSKPAVYARFVAWLEDWAATQDTHLMVFYDGQQGLHHGTEEPTPDELAELWQTAIRNATPYRRAHRDLDLSTRRIVEDVVMQDSQYSQLIQAVDLIAYGAYHLHRQNHPEVWGTKIKVMADAIRAYSRTRPHWLPESDSGVFWLDDPTQEPPTKAGGSRGARPPE